MVGKCDQHNCEIHNEVRKLFNENGVSCIKLLYSSTYFRGMQLKAYYENKSPWGYVEMEIDVIIEVSGLRQAGEESKICLFWKMMLVDPPIQKNWLTALVRKGKKKSVKAILQKKKAGRF